jgi:hypothetical protein
LLNMMISGSIHFPPDSMKCYSFLWLNNTPICIYTTFSLFIGWWAPRQFHSLAIVNSAVIDMAVQNLYCMLTCIPSITCSEVA